MFEQIAKRAAKRALKKMFFGLLAKLAPYIGIILGILVAAVLAYFVLFELPKQAIMGIFEGDDRESAYEYGESRTNDEQKMFEKYPVMAARWSEELTEEQLAQVTAYELDWGYLAAVDRTLGDPRQSGARDANELVLDPEATFELVRPKFEWMEAERKIEHQWCEVTRKEVTDEETGETTIVEEKHIRTNTTYTIDTLLVRAQTMQGIYVYDYRTEVSTSTSDSQCGTLTDTTTYLALDGITAIQNEWEPLKEILSAHGITEEKDQDFLLEYWMTFLVDLDGMEHHRALPDGWMPIEMELLWPMDFVEGRVSSLYGYRIHPITGTRELHRGLDIAAPSGVDVYAAKEGEVIHAGFLGNAGLAVIVNHGETETRYFHLSKVLVRKGASVAKGDTIGKVGSTGASTGPHLHFETWVGGEPVDPLLFYGGGN